MQRCALLAMLLSMSASVGRAQPCPPKPPAGAPVWFDFQVEVPVQFTGDSSRLPYPDASLNRQRPFPDDFALAQFIVDTTGRVEARTVKLLKAPAAVSIDSVRSASERWQFTPATLQKCRVPQLVMIALRWK